MRDSQAAEAGSSTKHAERELDEPAERRHDAGERDEDSGRERRRRERGEDEVVEEEGPCLYMDAAMKEAAAKRRARSPLQPYRPPIALLSKKERSRMSGSGSIKDRLGTTTSVSEAVTNPRPARIPFLSALFVSRIS